MDSRKQSKPRDMVPGGDGSLHPLQVLYRYRWMVATVFIVFTIAGTVRTFRTVPIYEARVQLLIEPENPNVISFKEVLDQDKSTIAYYQTQYRLLASRLLAHRTIEKLKLWKHPLLGHAPAPQAKAVLKSGNDVVARVWSAIAGMRAAVNRAVETTEAPAPSETMAQSAAVDAFLSGLSIVPVVNSRLAEIRYRSSDPVFAATVANGLGRAYIEQNLEFKFLASKEASDWLGQQLAEQRKQLETSELALQHYKEENDAVSLEDRQNIVVQKLGDLNTAVTKAKTDRINKEALYRQVMAIQKDPTALDSYSAVLGNEFIQRLKAQLVDLQRQQVQLSASFGDLHPDMIKLRSMITAAQAKLDAEIRKVVDSVRNDYLAVQAQERGLVEALDAQKQEALSLNRKAIDFAVLQRDSASNQQIFDSLVQRTKETGVAGELKASNIRIVDAAEVPRTPVLPQKAPAVLLAMALGLIVAFGMAFSFNYLDNRVKMPEEIEQRLGLPFLGLVPKAIGDGPPLISNGVQPSFGESLRSIRTNILFSFADNGSRALAVTSTQALEGKTTVCANLAIGLAQNGDRVLLIDADLRRPALDTLFNVSREPGLTNVLVGKAKAADALRRCAIPGLWLLPSGHHPPNPSEMLGSQRFKELLAQFAELFDWIVIDAPPVMPVTDAALLGNVVAGVVFVVGADMTNHRAAKIAIDRLRVGKTRILGGVLNRVNVDRNPYYYAAHYSRAHNKYYAEAVPLPHIADNPRRTA